MTYGDGSPQTTRVPFSHRRETPLFFLHILIAEFTFLHGFLRGTAELTILACGSFAGCRKLLDVESGGVFFRAGTISRVHEPWSPLVPPKASKPAPKSLRVMTAAPERQRDHHPWVGRGRRIVAAVSLRWRRVTTTIWNKGRCLRS
jgi:hypothetical protein